MPTTATTALGHNNPPDDVAILQERLRNAFADLLQHADELCRNVNDLPKEIADDEHAGDASDMIKLITGARKNLEAARVAEKEPFLSQGRAIDGFFKVSIDKLDAAMRVAKAPLDAWLRRKEAERRRAAEEEARRLREQQEAERQAALLLQQANQKESAAELLDQSQITGGQAAKVELQVAAKPAQLSQTRSNAGAVASLRAIWVGELVDIAILDIEKLRHHIAEDAWQKAINSYVRAGGRELRGAKIYEKTESVVR